MTPEEKKLLIETSQRLNQFLDLYHRIDQIDKFLLIKPLVLRNSNIKVEGTNGMKIAENATDKMSLWGVTPIVQPGAITTPSGGANIDPQARAAIASILAALRNVGVISV